MLEIDIRGVEGIQKMLQNMGRQMPFIISKALNETAKQVKEAQIKTINRVIDRPSRFTVNSLQVTVAKKNNLVAKVWFKDPPRFSDHHYLEPLVFGGGRRTKGFERALGGKFFMPGQGVKLDKHGNVTGGQIKQILSVLGRSERTAGYQSNMTGKSSLRGKARDFFLVTQQRGGLVPGVWQRVVSEGGKGVRSQGALVWQRGKVKRGRFHSVVRARGVRPILIQSKPPSYRKRYPFFEVAGQVVAKNIRRNLREARDYAMRTAR